MTPINTKTNSRFFDPIVWFQQTFGEYPNVFEFKNSFNIEVLEKLHKFEIIKKLREAELAIIDNNWNLVSQWNARISSCATLFNYKDGVWILACQLGRSKYEVRIYSKYNLEDEVEEIRDLLADCIYKEEKREQLGKINLLFQGPNGFYLKEKEIDPDFKCDINLNYGDDFVPHYEKLISSLKAEKKGLFLLSSKPGYGKTSLIKHIIQSVDKQKTLLLPPHLSKAFVDPAFLPFLTEQNIDLVILEDGEDCLRSRDERTGTAVSSILNITDGIMGDILGVKILATFNTSRESLDSALLRRGRLKWFHEFSLMKPEYCDRLLQNLGMPPQGKSMSLADIYNSAEETGLQVKEPARMGF